MFKEVGLQLEIKTNLKKESFLEVTFNLITGLYTPYKKPNDNLLYINPLSAKITKWSNTLKQFVGNSPTNCLSVFDHFAGLVLKGLIHPPITHPK